MEIVYFVRVIFNNWHARKTTKYSIKSNNSDNLVINNWDVYKEFVIGDLSYRLPTLPTFSPPKVD